MTTEQEEILIQIKQNFLDKYGISINEITNEYLSFLHFEADLLEVGCEMGEELVVLQNYGFSNLWGVDNDRETIELARRMTNHINLNLADLSNLPFRDNYFNLVYTTGTLSSKPRKEAIDIMAEITRVSKKYIFGVEAFQADLETPNINTIRINEYQNFFKRCYPGISLIHEGFIPHKNKDTMDIVYLLEKN